MTKLQHRQVNIDAQLATVRHIAVQLRVGTTVPVLAQLVTTLLDSNDGPMPLVELFNWARIKATTNSTVEQLRDDLFELLRICGHIGRHCAQVTAHSDQAVEPFDRDAIADRLDIVAARLLSESVRLRLLNTGRLQGPEAA